MIWNDPQHANRALIKPQTTATNYCIYYDNEKTSCYLNSIACMKYTECDGQENCSCYTERKDAPKNLNKQALK